MIAVGYGDAKATVEPERWLRWAKSKQLSLPNALQDFLIEQEKPKPLIEPERDTYQKLILGMAMAKYDYIPGAAKNKATGEKEGSIYIDLQLHNLTLDADTVRKYLEKAKEKFWDDIVKKS